jgi:hypothetical protein
MIKASSVTQAVEDARHTFSSENARPEERITITPRPDLLWKPTPAKPLPAEYNTPEMQAQRREWKRLLETPWIPPDDVATDPGRLEVWKSMHARELRVHDMMTGRLRMQSSFVRAEGCGLRDARSRGHRAPQ